ncbi:MAG: glycosyltransferase family 39 protein, partial [Verrucomicrobia bacterium]|nr:glycosyltransferase family 39 protein [Verrucomicrobiota bacterium]
SVHYVEIARDFAAGDFSMQYVKERPHRQPLYPALLALALKLGNGNRFTLGAVNIVFAEMSILAVYVSTLALFKHRLAAILSALALAANPFIDREITARLLTEPLHLFLTICAIFTFLRYMQRKDCRWLFACGGLLGLDYLTRPNGLIMAAAAVGTMTLADLLIAFRIAPGEYRFLCLFLFLQTLPLVWTNLSNPTARVPYGSMLPFELFLAALFFAWISGRPRIRAWFVERFAPGDKPGGPPIARLPVQSRTTLLVKYFKGAGFSLRSPRNRFEILGCKTASLAS